MTTVKALLYENGLCLVSKNQEPHEHEEDTECTEQSDDEDEEK